MRFAIISLFAVLLLALACPAQELLYPDYWFAYNTVDLDRPLAADSSIFQQSWLAIPFGEDRMIHFYSDEFMGDCYQVYDIYGKEIFPSPHLLLPALDPTQIGIPRVVPDGSNGFYAIVRNEALQEEGLYAQRLDSQGNLLWGNSGIELSEDEFHTDLRVSPDGVGGFLYTFKHTESNDIIVQRVNSTGQLLWGEDGVIVCNDPYVQDIPAVAHDEHGGAYVVWRDARPPHMWPDSRGYVQKVDSLGNTIWPLNGTLLADIDPRFLQLIPDREEGFVLHTSYGERGFAYRVDPIGHLLWERDYVSWGDEAQIAEGDSGYFYTAWYSDGGDSAYAQKMDMDGNMLWGDFPGVLMGTYNGLIALNSHLYIRYQNPNLYGVFTFMEYNYNRYILAQCIDSAGQKMWSMNGTLLSTPVGGCNNLFIAPDQLNGATAVFEVSLEGERNVFGKHINANGTLGGPKPVKVIPPTRAQITGFSEGEIRLDLPEAGSIQLDIYNLLGRRIRSVTEGYFIAGTQTVLFDDRGLAAGVYFIRLKADYGQVVRKMVVVR